MNRKLLLFLVLTPFIAIGIVVLVLLIFGIQIDFWLILFLIAISAPYGFAVYQEYRLESDDRILSAHELNLIQEKDNIVKTFEIISIILSFLFGLFMTFNFDLLISNDPIAQPVSYIANLFAFSFFMSTFSFISTQVLGKDAFMTEEELKKLNKDSPKTEQIKKLISKFKFANCVRMAIFYSLIVQIGLLYPIIIVVISF